MVFITCFGLVAGVAGSVLREERDVRTAPSSVDISTRHSDSVVANNGTSPPAEAERTIVTIGELRERATAKRYGVSVQEVRNRPDKYPLEKLEEAEYDHESDPDVCEVGPGPGDASLVEGRPEGAARAQSNCFIAGTAPLCIAFPWDCSKRPGGYVFRRHGKSSDDGYGEPCLSGRKLLCCKEYGKAPWPSYIPYLFASGVSDSVKHVVQLAMSEYTRTTCVRFQEIEKVRGAYLWITDTEEGCYASRVGYRPLCRSQLNLGSGCDTYGIALHELGHVLGRHHEQSRNDRDRYITVHKENVIDNRWNNFQKEPTAHTLHNYDYDSIMHYGDTSFSKASWKNGYKKKTITAPQEIGQRSYLSSGDIRRINHIYECDHEPEPSTEPGVLNFDIGPIAALTGTFLR